MFALRSKHGNPLRYLLLAFVAICAPLQAQTTAPRVGEVMPALDLPGNKDWATSRDFVGKRAQFWIIQGEQPLADANSILIQSARKAQTQGVAPFFIAPSGDLNWPIPFQTVSDPAKTVSRAVGSALFLAIDKAGWVRTVESLPSQAEDPQAFRLRFLLESTGDPTPTYALGKPAPDFCVKDASGVWRRLSALRGRKNLVLTFFPRCFTGKCKSQLSSLRDSYGGFQLGNTEVWAISVDPAEGESGQKAFSRSLQLPFPLLPDEGRNICFLFGAAQTPTDLAKRQSVLIDKEGIVRFIDREVAPETHGDDLLGHLKELGMTP